MLKIIDKKIIISIVFSIFFLIGGIFLITKLSNKNNKRNEPSFVTIKSNLYPFEYPVEKGKTIEQYLKEINCFQAPSKIYKVSRKKILINIGDPINSSETIEVQF